MPKVFFQLIIFDFEQTAIKLNLVQNLKIKILGYASCQNTFSVYKWESSDDIATDDYPQWSDSKGSYEKLKTIAAQVRKS